MPQSHSNVILHLVFSTKDRYPFMDLEIRDRMHGYLAKLCRELDSICYKVGGVADHVHIVTTLPRTISQSAYLEDIKKKSSGWIKGVDPDRYGKFYWQRGYGAFSVSASNLADVIHYAANQEEHHRKVTFQDEYRMLLEKHDIDWDERYVWD